MPGAEIIFLDHLHNTVTGIYYTDVVLILGKQAEETRECSMKRSDSTYVIDIKITSAIFLFANLLVPLLAIEQVSG